MSDDQQGGRVGILGAGIAGLTVAYRLAQKGYEVTLFDKNREVGGQLATINVRNTPLEIYYHHVFQSDASLIELCRELGLDNKLLYLPSSMGYYSNGRLYDFGTPYSLLFFSPLSFIDKIRFVASIFLLKRIPRQEYTESLTAEEWLRKYAGDKVFEVIWQPLFMLKFDQDYSRLPLTWIWDKIRLRGSSRQRGGWREQLIYMDGSFSGLIVGLRRELAKYGCRLRLHTDISKISKKNDEFEIITAAGDRCFCDRIVSTLPSDIMAELYDFSPAYREELQNLRYKAVICVLLESTQKFSHIYWMNIGDTSLPFGGIIEHTNFYGADLYGGMNIIYVSRYLDPAQEMYAYDDDAILKLFLAGMKKINPEFDENNIVSARVFRNNHAQPVIIKGYQKPDIQTEVPGLYWLSTHHLYPHDRGINYAIALANELAARF
ncbi:MAG: NAD(P)/FAD-dependent oxidoreductase [Deltaproteobacteria bacterium]|nr:NAD(P)/FAD-dependent oxidoreductase [Deltaproteobacteria bacterium]